MMFPLVRDLADDGIPVTVTCRVVDVPLGGVEAGGVHR